MLLMVVALVVLMFAGGGVCVWMVCVVLFPSVVDTIDVSGCLLVTVFLFFVLSGGGVFFVVCC